MFEEVMEAGLNNLQAKFYISGIVKINPAERSM